MGAGDESPARCVGGKAAGIGRRKWVADLGHAATELCALYVHRALRNTVLNLNYSLCLASV